jgi:hypothetical protein
VSIIERAAGKLEKERSRSFDPISPREPVDSSTKFADERAGQTAADPSAPAVATDRIKSPMGAVAS